MHRPKVLGVESTNGCSAPPAAAMTVAPCAAAMAIAGLLNQARTGMDAVNTANCRSSACHIGTSESEGESRRDQQ